MLNGSHFCKYSAVCIAYKQDIGSQKILVFAIGYETFQHRNEGPTTRIGSFANPRHLAGTEPLAVGGLDPMPNGNIPVRKFLGGGGHKHER